MRKDYGLQRRSTNMIRHPDNSNLSLHIDHTYKGLPVQVEKGPFIRKYLANLLVTINRSLTHYPRVFAFRVDLRLPAVGSRPEYLCSNEVIERFFASLKAKIRHNRDMARLVNKCTHDSQVRYVWVRELGQQGRPHYHVLILLNRDAFCSLGSFTSGKDNMFNRLQEAWASALCLSEEAVKGLVEVPRNPCYYLDREGGEGLAALFFRASYLCKAATKGYGDGQHAFGCSRT